VPEFLEIVDRGAFGALGAEWGVAARAALPFHGVATLRPVRQREQRPRLRLGPRDELRRNPVIADDREAELLERAAQLAGEFGQRPRERNGAISVIPRA
jgi:hypothetical protein